MRELSRLPVGAAMAFTIAALVALSVTYEVSFFPPGLKARQLEVATASTHVLIDAPKSTILDLRYGTSDFKSLSDRGVLLGNVMASAPVREYIARRAGIPAEIIEASTPLTPDYPRAIAETGHEKHTTDILKSPGQYRLSIQANPTVPILDVIAQAPDAKVAEKLADAAVNGLRDYIDNVALEQDIGPEQRIHLEQLGKARGGVINAGVGLQVVLLSFFVTLAMTSAAVLFLARVRRGWILASRPTSRPAEGH